MDSVNGFHIFGNIIQPKPEENYKRDRKKPRTASLNRFSERNNNNDDDGDDEDSISHMIINNSNNTLMEFLKNVITTEFKQYREFSHHDDLVKRLCVRLYTALQNNEEIKKSEMVIAQELQDMKHEMEQFSSMIVNKKYRQRSKKSEKTTTTSSLNGNASNSSFQLNHDDESSLELCRKQILSQSSFLSQIDYNHIDFMDNVNPKCDKSSQDCNNHRQPSSSSSMADPNVQMLIEQIKTLENKIESERQNYLEENERLNLVIDEKQKIVDELLSAAQEKHHQRQQQTSTTNNRICDSMTTATTSPINNPLQGLFDWRIEDNSGCEILNSGHHQCEVYHNQQQPSPIQDSGNSLYNFQTNNRLLVVLSDLVKTFLDTENDIQNQLESLGLERSKSSPLNRTNNNNDDLLAFPSLEEERLLMSTTEITTFDLCEDGPDLTTPSSLMFPNTTTTTTTTGNNTLSAAGPSTSVSGNVAQNDVEDDVVLGASRRLRLAVERVLKILADTLDDRKNDYQELLKQKEDLRLEFQEECQRSDQLTRQLMDKENLIKNLEMKCQEFVEKLLDFDEMKDQQEKLKEKLEEFERERDRFVTDHKRFEMERKSFDQGLPQLHQKIINENETLSKDIRVLQQEKKNLLAKINYLTSEVESLKTEKDQIIENKNAEFEELISQIDSKEKNLNSLKRFIEEQTQERESERDDFTKEVASLKDKIKEKEKYENKLKSKIRSLESQMSMLNEDKQQKDDQLDEMDKKLKELNGKLTDLNVQKRQLEAEIEKNNQMEQDLRARLKKLCNVLQVKLNDETDWNQVMDALDQLIINKCQSTTVLTAPSSALEGGSRIERLGKKNQFNEKNLDNSIFVTIKLMDDKLQELNGNIDQLTKKNESLQLELDGKNKQIEHLEQIRSKMETTEKTLKELTKTNELLQQEINESHLKYSELKVKLDSSVDIQEFKRVCDELQNKLNQEKQQNEQLSVKLEQANRRTNELNEKLDAYKKEIRSFKELLKTHDLNQQQQQPGADPKSSNQNKDNGNGKTSVDRRNSKDLNFEINQLNNRLEVKDRTITLLEQNVDILKSKLNSITQERDIYAERIKNVDDTKTNKIQCYEKNLEKLRLQNKIQSDKITYLELEIQSLRKKIEILDNENEMLKLENGKLLKQKQEINAAMLVDYVDEQTTDLMMVNGVGNGNPNGTAVYLNGFDKMNHISSNNLLMLKVRRLLTQKGALIYQKNYLIHVLGSYQRTENDTLALLANFNNSKDVEDDEVTKMRGKSKFRSIVYGLIALNRMKFMVNIWQCRKRQLLFHKTANSIASLQNVPLPPRKSLKDNLKNGGLTFASQPSSSLNSNQAASNPLNQHYQQQLKLNSSMSSSTPINSTLKDYVDRLHVVHETLGLHTNKRL